VFVVEELDLAEPQQREALVRLAACGTWPDYTSVRSRK
jgi:Zn-dependent alcohol dehydrogenase